MSPEQRLSRYLTSPRLTREEERLLIYKWREEGSLKARDELVLRHLYIVNYAVLRYRNKQHSDYWDLMHEGIMGLMTAAGKFNLESETRFATYAVHWARKEVRFSCLNDTTVRVPINEIAKSRILERAIAAIVSLKGGRPSYEELALLLGVSVKHAKRLDELSRGSTFSGDIPQKMAGGEEGRSLFENIPNLMLLGPEEAAIASDELSRAIYRVSSILGFIRAKSERTFVIVQKRFGLDGTRTAKTLEEIGQEYGLTRERIRQIVDRAFSKIRDPELRGSEDDFRELMDRIVFLEEVLEMKVY